MESVHEILAQLTDLQTQYSKVKDIIITGGEPLIQQNIDILDIPIAEVTRQYMAYVELVQLVKLELAAEYLVMAAVLAEIKSRMLLPRPSEEQDEEDPRAELVRRLQEYERYRKVAEDLDSRPRVGRDIHVVVVDFNAKPVQ